MSFRLLQKILPISLTLLLTISICSVIGGFGLARGTTQSTSLKNALNWLYSKQGSDGSFDDSQISTPGAAYALWLNDSSSTKAKASLTWLASQLDNSSSYAWGEADIPGQILYTLRTTSTFETFSHNVSSDVSNLLSYRQQDGGFIGYYTQLSNGTYVQIETSVDTAQALRGLTINQTKASQSVVAKAADYLFKLQNSDGSFNLTNTISYSPDNALGPEPIGITALVVLALRYAGYKSDAHVSKALDYLSKSASDNFTSAKDGMPIYGAALSALVFQDFSLQTQASTTIAWLSAKQDSTGGFRDGARLSTGPNALDTGWATVAVEEQYLQNQGVQHVQQTSQPPLSNIDIIAGLLGILVVAVGLGYVLYRKRVSTQGPVVPSQSSVQNIF